MWLKTFLILTEEQAIWGKLSPCFQVFAEHLVLVQQCFRVFAVFSPVLNRATKYKAKWWGSFLPCKLDSVNVSTAVLLLELEGTRLPERTNTKRQGMPGHPRPLCCGRSTKSNSIWKFLYVLSTESHAIYEYLAVSSLLHLHRVLRQCLSRRSVFESYYFTSNFKNRSLFRTFGGVGGVFRKCNLIAVYTIMLKDGIVSKFWFFYSFKSW